jgi:hypothetical protein
MDDGSNGRSTRTAAAVAASLVAVAALVAVAVVLLRGGGEEPEEAAPPTEEAPTTEEVTEEATEEATEEGPTYPLTGLPMEQDPERPALIVKVSNSPEARPWTGLDEADVVYEELVEFGVTRFLAVLHSQLPEVLGPVRSARPVDAQIAAGYATPGFAYSGGRDEVHALLRNAPIVVISEGAAPGFFRDNAGRYASDPVAPHNLFLRPEEALEVVVDRGAEVLGDLGWDFDDGPPDGDDGPGTELEVAMSDSFTTGWTYDAPAGRYRRSQNGRPSLVTGPGEIGAANVVVLAVRHYVGDSGYPETDVLGEGDALILRDGRRYLARWSKPTATDALTLRTADDEVFPLKPGPTWILLPDELPDPDAGGG